MTDGATCRPTGSRRSPATASGPEVVAARPACRRCGRRRGSASRSTGRSTSSAAPRSTPTGSPSGDEDVAACGAADAILLGAVGGPKWSDPGAAVRPEQALFALRGGLGLYANLRPVTVHPALVGVVAAPAGAARRRRHAHRPRADRRALLRRRGPRPSGEPRRARPRSTRCRTRSTRSRGSSGSRSSWRATRRGRRDQVDKANVLATSRLWRTVADEVAASTRTSRSATSSSTRARCCSSAGRPTSTSSSPRTCSATSCPTRRPCWPAPSGCCRPRRSASAGPTHGTFGLYEPIHGSAPDIAGQDVANPIGTILSAAMLLRLSLGRERRGRRRSRRPSARALDDGWRTADLADPADAGRRARRRRHDRLRDRRHRGPRGRRRAAAA